MADRYNESLADVRNRLRNSQDNSKKHHKNNLKDKASKSVQTVMIGCLADMEKEFGYLWGHGKETRTKEEQAMFEKWQALRTSILDRGNTSLNILLKNIDKCEINNYDNRYHWSFVNKE